nr:Retrovirus-related Pol polyprotein from transposon TNT 1-94 [Ipomoea batatas]
MEQVTTFLRGLNECYSSVKSQIMLMTPLPMIGKACAFVQQQEREVMRTSQSEATGQSAFLARGWKGRNDKRLGSTNEQKSVAAMVTGTSGQHSFVANSPLESGFIDSSGEPQLKASEPQPKANALVASFKPLAVDGKKPINYRSPGWIIDTGATHHIVNNVDYLLDFHEVSDMLVLLPNGNYATVSHMGSVQLIYDIILHGVLCVPKFGFCLISVSRLTNTMSCSLRFYDNLCKIQIGTMQKTIDFVKGGLYQFIEAEQSHVMSTTAFDFWHYRLGHASAERIRKLRRLDDTISCQPNLSCEVCHLAKQRKLPFPFVLTQFETRVKSISNIKSPDFCIPLPTYGTCYLYDCHKSDNSPTVSCDGQAADDLDYISSGYNVLANGNQEVSSHADPSSQNAFTSPTQSVSSMHLDPQTNQEQSPGQNDVGSQLNCLPSQEQSSGQHALNSQMDSQISQEQLLPVIPVLRRSNRHRVPPSYHKDYHCSLLKNPPSSSCVQMTGSPHELSRVIGYDDWVLDLALKDFTDHRSTILHIRY